MDKREQTRERVKRYRERQKDVALQPSVTSYHPIIEDLVDSVTRKKLEAICTALSKHKLQDKVFYGIGEYGLPVNIVGDLLDATG